MLKQTYQTKADARETTANIEKYSYK